MAPRPHPRGAGSGFATAGRVGAMRGVVAAGHPLTAHAGADVLRAGGNAVDAAVAAMLMSFVTESPLTGPGRGRLHARPHARPARTTCSTSSWRRRAGPRKPASPPRSRRSTSSSPPDAIQRFNCGPSSCGVYGTPRGWPRRSGAFGTARRSPTSPRRPARAAREGVEVIPMQAFLFADPRADPRAPRPEAAAIYAPEGRLLRAGERVYCRSSPTCSSGSAPRGPGSCTTATSPPP